MKKITMKHFRTTICLLLTVILLLTTLCACGGNEDNQSETSDTPNTSMSDKTPETSGDTSTTPNTSDGVPSTGDDPATSGTENSETSGTDDPSQPDTSGTTGTDDPTTPPPVTPGTTDDDNKTSGGGNTSGNDKDPNGNTGGDNSGSGNEGNDNNTTTPGTSIGGGSGNQGNTGNQGNQGNQGNTGNQGNQGNTGGNTGENPGGNTGGNGNSGSQPPAHTHSYTSSITTAATCTTNGVKTFKCSSGESYTEKIDATGHSWGEWKTIKEPTTSAEGTSQRKCNNCSATENKSIDKLPSNDPAVTDAMLKKIQTYFFELVNAERAKNGLCQFRASSILDEFAKIRSEELLKRYSHTRPDGTYFDTVIDPSKYVYLELGENCSYVYHIGTNVYDENKDKWVGSDEQLKNVAKCFFESFIKSPAHYANMMKSTYEECGIGISWYIDEGYYNLPVFYISHLFAKPFVYE